MRLHISHNTTYRYDTPPAAVTQILRLTPRNHDGQHVVRWRVELSEDCILHEHEDAYGNLTHTFTADGPLNELVITVNGEVDTQDTHGIVRNAVERFPPQFFLRETDLTKPDAAIRDLAAELRDAGDPATLPLLHRLLARLHRDIVFDVAPTSPATTASEAFALKRGVCQDIAHIFLSASRLLGIPARYIGGHLARSDDALQQEAGHAWIEAHVPDLGWVSFDPANGISATDAYVRVAVGLDYLGASPVRGSRIGGAGEALKVAVAVAQSRQQIQD
ncbi:MAG: transglutaminase family protein [Pseudolabrys sp.]|nr:transglutaminase family protein [Pseudolabrys sp.]MCW5685711.1 transglutaminase family protein [Pseudolabrys sp.]